MMSFRTVLSAACLTSVIGIVGLAQTSTPDVTEDVTAYMHGEPSTSIANEKMTVSVTPDDPREGLRGRLRNLFDPAITGVTPDVVRGAEGWHRNRDARNAVKPGRRAARRAHADRPKPVRTGAGGRASSAKRLTAAPPSRGEFSMYRRSRFYEKRLRDDRDRRHRKNNNRINNSRIRFSRPANGIAGRPNQLSVFERSNYYGRYGSHYDTNSHTRKRRRGTTGRFRGR